MTFASTISTSKRTRGRKTILCGPGGTGKTTAAAKWPRPVLLSTEDGAADIDIPAFHGGRPATNYDELMGPIIELGSGDDRPPFDSLILDSADWAESIFCQHVAAKNGKQSLAEIKNDFGKSQGEANGMFTKMLVAMDYLREKWSMNIVLTCHQTAFRFEDPSGESYDIIGPKLHTNSKGEGTGAVVYEWCDEMFFFRQPVHRMSKEEGFGRKRTVTAADGDPVICTKPEPALRAKCRMHGVPDQFSRDEITEYIDRLPTAKGGK